MLSFKSFLEEAPMLVSPDEFGLDNAMGNFKVWKKIKDKTRHIFEENDDYSLFQVGTWYNGYVIMLDKKVHKIVYLIQTIKESIPHFGSAVCQIKLWRDDSSLLVQGVTKKMFFDVLLNNNGVIVSDSVQTNDGMKFWIRRLADAINLHKKVYLVNTKTKELHEYNPKERYDTWINGLKNKAWGSGSNFSDWRFVISKDQFSK